MKNKKSRKIIKTEHFKKQEKALPPAVKKELKKVLKQISLDPINAPNSMNLFGPPSPEELKNWMYKVKPETIDLVFEYLRDKECLTHKGQKLAYDFWEKYIKKELKG